MYPLRSPDMCTLRPLRQARWAEGLVHSPPRAHLGPTWSCIVSCFPVTNAGQVTAAARPGCEGRGLDSPPPNWRAPVSGCAAVRRRVAKGQRHGGAAGARGGTPLPRQGSCCRLRVYVFLLPVCQVEVACTATVLGPDSHTPPAAPRTTCLHTTHRPTHCHPHGAGFHPLKAAAICLSRQMALPAQQWPTAT